MGVKSSVTFLSNGDPYEVEHELLCSQERRICRKPLRPDIIVISISKSSVHACK